MWSHVKTCLGPQLRDIFFGTAGTPRPIWRDTTEEICRKLGIRHAFGREGEQSWLRTVFLQFGLSRKGFQRLPTWLGQGALLPVAVQELLSESSKLYSPTFAAFWMVLQRYRWGSLDQGQAVISLSGNPWIQTEDLQELLAATKSSRYVELVSSSLLSGWDQTQAVSILTEPRLRWFAAVPVFELALLPSPPVWMDGERYILTIIDQRIPILKTEAGWRLDNLEGRVAVEPTHPVLQVDLIQRGVSALGEALEIHLVPRQEPFVIYDLASGTRIDPTKGGFDFRRPAAVLHQSGISIVPSPKEYFRAFQGEWIFSAFREGLSPDLEIRDGDLIIWSPPSPEMENRTQATLFHRLTVSSGGGWWGEIVPVSVNSDLQLLRIRVGNQQIEVTKTPPNPFRGNLELLAGVDYGATAQIEYINKGRLERQPGNLHVATLSGVAIETENGWKPLNSALDIDIEYFQSRKVLTSLPLDWEGEKRQPEDWVFLEGDHFCQRPRRSISSLKDSLHGVGEPLRLSIGPYNHRSQGRKLTKGLLNSGVIKWVSLTTNNWELQLRISFELCENHSIWVWLFGDDTPRQLKRDQWWQRENVCVVRNTFESYPEGFAISYKGAWLGARTASSGLSGIQQIIQCTPSWPTSAKWLRWWRAPLLHESLKPSVRRAAVADPVNTLVAWLKVSPPGLGAEYSDSQEDAWLSVVRGTLWGWWPTPSQSHQAIQRLGLMTGISEIDLETCWSGFAPLLSANPILLTQLAVCGVDEMYIAFSTMERQIFSHMLQALILGLERTAAAPDLKSALKVCRREAAESMSVDEKFVTDSLLPLALELYNGKLVHDLNLRIALANAPIRKFLAVSLLQSAMSDQTYRGSK